MKRIVASLTLTCALSFSVFAGEIPTCGTSSVTGEVPAIGAEPAPVAGNTPPANPSTVPGEVDPSILITVLLTITGLIGR